MKQKFTILLAAVMLAFSGVALTTVTSGCAGQQSARQVSYKTLKSTWLAVDAAMKTANELYRTDKINEAQRLEIIKAHTAYRKAMDVAITAAEMNWSTATPANVAALATELVTLIASFQ